MKMLTTFLLVAMQSIFLAPPRQHQPHSCFDRQIRDWGGSPLYGANRVWAQPFRLMGLLSAIEPTLPAH